MKKTYALITAIVLVFLFTQSNAQCTGGRYHDIIFPDNPTVTSNLKYGQNLDTAGANVDLYLDVYQPACDASTNRACIVFAHGGGFVSGDKADATYAQTCIALAKMGYVVASINYRMGIQTGTTGFPPPGLYGFNSTIVRAVHDARAAVRYMRHNASTYGINVNEMYFGGVSAGGIIALHYAYMNTTAEMLDCGGQPGTNQSSVEGLSNNLTESSAVKGIISISGCIRDLNFIGNNDIPVCMAHGDVDGTVPYAQGKFGIFDVWGSSSIATKCQQTGTKYCFKRMINQDHTPANFAYLDTISVLMRNFLEHLVCGVTLECNYTTPPAVTSGGTASIAITTGSNPSCTGQSVTFTATTSASSPTYTWKNGTTTVGTNSATYTYTPTNGDVITCVVTPGGNCTGSPITSNAITMQVTSGGSPSVNISITSGSNPSCTGQAVTLTATNSNGGQTPTYLWKKGTTNVGTNSPTYTFTPTNGDVITCELTSSSSCASPNKVTSNAITITVTSSTTASVSIAVTSGSNPACAGQAVTLTATPTNGGNAPTYQWKVGSNNAGVNSPAYTYTPTNGDVVTVEMTSNSSCANPATATSNAITLTTTSSTPASVTIALTSGSNPACAGQAVTFTATPTNGGSAPSYQWKKGGANVGANSDTYTYTPANGDVITVEMTSNSSCANPATATSNAVTLSTTNSSAPSVSIAVTGGSNPTCTGQPVTLTATPANGGTSPSYQWKSNGNNVGTNSNTYTYSPTGNDAISVEMTSNSSCANPATATSNTINISIASAVAPAVSIAITSGSNPSCTGASVTFTATPTNGGNTPTYQWKVGGNNAGSNSDTYTYTPADGDVVTCEITSALSCANPTTATSNAITMAVTSATVSPTIAVNITGGSNPTCAGKPVTFTATSTNGGGSPVYQWKNNGSNVGTGETFTSSTLANNDQISCELTSSSSCASPGTVTSTPITMSISPAPSISRNGNTLTSSPGTTYKWYRNGAPIGGATGQTFTATGSGNYTVEVNGCQSAPVTVVISGVEDIANFATSVTVYPNPNNGNFTVSFSAAEKGDYKLDIVNIIGVSVYNEVLTGFSGDFERAVDATKYAKGTYLLSLSNSNNRAIKRLIIY